MMTKSHFLGSTFTMLLLRHLGTDKDELIYSETTADDMSARTTVSGEAAT